jgi:hypothetical protein
MDTLKSNEDLKTLFEQVTNLRNIELDYLKVHKDKDHIDRCRYISGIVRGYNDIRRAIRILILKRDKINGKIS